MLAYVIRQYSQDQVKQLLLRGTGRNSEQIKGSSSPWFGPGLTHQPMFDSLGLPSIRPLLILKPNSYWTLYSRTLWLLSALSVWIGNFAFANHTKRTCSVSEGIIHIYSNNLLELFIWGFVIHPHRINLRLMLFTIMRELDFHCYKDSNLFLYYWVYWKRKVNQSY